MERPRRAPNLQGRPQRPSRRDPRPRTGFSRASTARRRGASDTASHRKMTDLNWAYSILRDTNRRAEYDRERRVGVVRGRAISCHRQALRRRLPRVGRQRCDARLRALLGLAAARRRAAGPRVPALAEPALVRRAASGRDKDAPLRRGPPAALSPPPEERAASQICCCWHLSANESADLLVPANIGHPERPAWPFFAGLGKFSHPWPILARPANVLWPRDGSVSESPPYPCY